MVITVGASPRAGVWLGWHMPIRYSWKQMLLGSQAHWLKRLWKGSKSKWISQRIALLDPTVQRFSCHRRGEVDCGRRTSRRRKDKRTYRRRKKCYPPERQCSLSNIIFNTKPFLFLLMCKDATFGMGRWHRILFSWSQSEFDEEVQATL